MPDTEQLAAAYRAAGELSAATPSEVGLEVGQLRWALLCLPDLKLALPIADSVRRGPRLEHGLIDRTSNALSKRLQGDSPSAHASSIDLLGRSSVDGRLWFLMLNDSVELGLGQLALLKSAPSIFSNLRRHAEKWLQCADPGRPRHGALDRVSRDAIRRPVFVPVAQYLQQNSILRGDDSPRIDVIWLFWVAEFNALSASARPAQGGLNRTLEQLAEYRTGFDGGYETVNGDPAVAEADAANLERYFEWRVAVLRESWTTVDVSARLGITPQAIRKRIKQKQLLAIKHAGDYRFPLWQFDPSEDAGIVRGLSEVFSATSMEPLLLAAWLTRPQPSLDDRRPIDVLRSGEVEAVLAEARGFGFT